LQIMLQTDRHAPGQTFMSFSYFTIFDITFIYLRPEFF
jgi:hypothetical protein